MKTSIAAPLNPSETTTLAALLKRAIHNSQFQINVASPFEGGMKEARKYGFSINDRHDGNGVCSNAWNVEVSENVDDGRCEIAVYVDEKALDSLVGMNV